MGPDYWRKRKQHVVPDLPVHSLTEWRPCRYYNAINERRLDDAIALYSEDCTHHNLAFSRPAKGKQARAMQ